MLHILPYTPDWSTQPVLRAMFAARKRVFIDLLRWDLPVHDGDYELDDFDRPGAVYLVLADADASHRASARLLPTDRPHLLDSLFENLCTSPPPTGSAVREITRFCLDRPLRAAGRRQARDELVSRLADHALAQGISTYTGVAEIEWFRQISGFGWHCRSLGDPVRYPDQTLTALKIDITSETPDLLARAGFYRCAAAHEGVRHAA